MEGITSRLETIASRLEAIASRLQNVGGHLGWRALLVGWRPSLVGWRPSVSHLVQSLLVKSLGLSRLPPLPCVVGEELAAVVGSFPVLRGHVKDCPRQDV